MDNNHSERVIRPLTIGRKNWMFLGSAEAAPGRMKLFSIVSSAQRHCLSIQDYLEDIFLKLSQAAQHRPQDLKLGCTIADEPATRPLGRNASATCEPPPPPRKAASS